MKKTLLGIVGVMMITAMSAFAAFTPPTAAQLTAAANNPAAIAALLEGASPEQAAQVIKAVVVQIASMGLSAPAQAASIGSVIAAAFSAAPAGSAPMLAASLGTACGASLAVSGNPAVVSSIQGAIATAGGSGGAAMAQTFGTAYSEAKAASQASNNDVLGSAPPLATGYTGQQNPI
ncbi:MAG: hypothetical protein WCI03_13020 [bacterium]